MQKKKLPQQGEQRAIISVFLGQSLDGLGPGDPFRDFYNTQTRERLLTNPEIYFSDAEKYFYLGMRPFYEKPELRSEDEMLVFYDSLPREKSNSALVEYEGKIKIRNGGELDSLVTRFEELAEAQLVELDAPSLFTLLNSKRGPFNPLLGFSGNKFFVTFAGDNNIYWAHFVGRASVIDFDQGGKEVFSFELVSGAQA